VFKGSRIAVVVPAHDEEAFIASTIRSIPDFVDVIVVVDDASTDGTSRQIEMLADPRTLLMRSAEFLGVGGATVVGYRRALELDAEIVVKMDGDGQMPPEHVHDLLEAIIDRGYDYAKGNRFLRPDALSAMPRSRLLANMLMTFLTKIASGYWHIFDPQNGFTAIRCSHLRRLDLARVDTSYFFENDMLIQLYLLAARVCDVGMPARYGEEVSGVRPLHIALRFPPRLIRAFLRRIHIRYVLVDFSPVALFLGLGSVLFLWGLGFGIHLWIRTLLTGNLTPTGTIMLALLPLIMGFQLILQGIVLDIQETPR
jgi:glycosyltransferase involved in cell wall biosynthesis